MAKLRVRARAVDMLGRQQIAGIPTAIHELFKNAHDAYAEHVEVDYFRGDGAFVLRDDGYGMTREEFENNWLTIGTESKVNANALPLPTFLGTTERRPVLGEKGIGRLSIATIGPQVLVLTRALRQDGLHDLVVCFINWGLFEVPGIDIDQIDIPIETLSNGELPDEAFVRRLVARVEHNVRELSTRIEPDVLTRLLEQLSAFNIDPAAVQDSLGNPTLKGNGYGTHFYILPVDPMLESDIDEDREDYATPLKKMLLGFSNTMLPGRPDPAILARFRDHRQDGNVIELIGEKEFFTPDQFKNADHHFIGTFNEYGQFNGTLSYYRQPEISFQVSWPDAHGVKTECGPFQIRVAYIQGLANESKLPPEDWAYIIAKLNKIGGLYIYKDGIRILPYGNADYDFLHIEDRRTRAAKDWFFSYRRMFGAVEISHKDNHKLIEKAGREGFRTNKAYKQMKDILANFFKQLAKDFFRKDSVYGDEYQAIKDQIRKDAELLEKRKTKNRLRKQIFSATLDDFFRKLEEGKPSEAATIIIENAQRRASVIADIKEPEQAARELLRLEADLRKEIGKLRNEYQISKLRGIGLTKKQMSDWEAYQKNIAKIDEEVFVPVENAVEEIINGLATTSAAALNRRRRISQALDDVSTSRKREISALTRKTKAEAEELATTVMQEAQKRLVSIDSTITLIYSEFAEAETSNLSDEQLTTLQKRFLDRISDSAKAESEALESILHQLHSMAEAISNNESFEDETAALESALQGKIEELEVYSDLAQVGTAVGIVHHELHGVIKGIRENFNKFRPWAKVNKPLNEIYVGLKTSFDHLDNYLKLFTPLSRRLNRERSEISGEHIWKYLIDIFDSRLLRHKVKLLATEDFKGKVVKGFPSTLYPTFVNLVDNAIYWLTSRKEGLRNIVLDAVPEGFLVVNSGPGIPLRDADRIFEFGISSKPGGRGMGLYISRETLRREGYDLVLTNPGENNQPAFQIILKSAKNSDAERSE
jgi:signal transduction histidine kinase